MFYWLQGNSGAVQAITGIVSLVLAIPTLIFLVKAVRAANRQAEASVALIAVSEAQRLASEKAANAADKQSAIALQALRDATIPFAVLIAESDTTGQIRYFVENQGSGAAHNVTLEFGDPGNVTSKALLGLNLLGPGGRAPVIGARGVLLKKDFTLRFETSLDGRYYQIYGHIDGFTVTQQLGSYGGPSDMMTNVLSPG